VILPIMRGACPAIAGRIGHTGVRPGNHELTSCRRAERAARPTTASNLRKAFADSFPTRAISLSSAEFSPTRAHGAVVRIGKCNDRSRTR